MNELLGKECEIVFSIPRDEWPFQSSCGTSLTAIIECIDMPMVKLRAYWGSSVIWVNVSIIQSIQQRRE